VIRRMILSFLIVLMLAVSVGCSTQSADTSSDSSTPTSTTTSDTTPSTGTPPSGTPPTGAAPGGSSSGTSTATNISGAFALSSGTKTTTGQFYSATTDDQSAIYVTGTGVLTLTNPTVTTSGDTSSQGNSSFYGQHARVLAAGGGTIHMTAGTITTTGAGANGAFSTGTGSQVTLSQTTIDAKGDGGHAVMATQGGSMTLSDVKMTTAGKNSGAIATDRGGGTITATGGTVVTSGQDSPAVYSTGAITISGGTLTATGSEAAVIEGANSITLNNCVTTSTFANKWGVMIFQSMSGDAEGARGVFTVTGGSLKYTASSGPLFYVTNTTAIITLKDTDVSVASGILINAAGGTRWGTSGSNGGIVEFTADAQTLAGSVVADKISTVALTLKNGSSLTGAINTAKTAKSASLTLDASSTWTITADSHLTALSDTAGISGTTITNIIGNGHTVTYDSSANPGLGGKTYTLSGGGVLKPAS
jgi:hypothetical protein